MLGQVEAVLQQQGGLERLAAGDVPDQLAVDRHVERGAVEGLVLEPGDGGGDDDEGGDELAGDRRAEPATRWHAGGRLDAAWPAAQGLGGPRDGPRVPLTTRFEPDRLTKSAQSYCQ